MGLPAWRPSQGRYVATCGAARISGLAAAQILVLAAAEVLVLAPPRNPAGH
jgi:hypothetical protein